MARYTPTALALAKPRRYFVEATAKWIGIGGAITVYNDPPIVPASYIVPEATQAEYKALYELGLTHLVSKSDDTQRDDTTGAEQSDTGLDK